MTNVDVPFEFPSGMYRPQSSIDDVTFAESQDVFCLTCRAVEKQGCTDDAGRRIGDTHVDRLERAARFRDWMRRDKTAAEDDVYAEAVARYAGTYDKRIHNSVKRRRDDGDGDLVSA